jgi:hypothetical protein
MLVAMAVSAAGYALHRSGYALALVMPLAVAVIVVAWSTPWIGVRLLDRVLLAVRAARWRGEEGRHHAFGGLSLHVEDDGRHVWLLGGDVQRVLGTRERADVFAARMPGRWRPAPDGDVLVRADAVVEHLASAPGRMDPRRLRFKRYLEREVLFPAAERRRRP